MKIFPSIEEYKKRLDVLSHNAAAGGARVIVWQEYGFQIAEDEEPAFIDYCSSLARGENVYICIGLIVYKKNLNLKGENKSILINPDGKVEWQYVKYNLVPGLETAKIKRGKPVLPFVQTPYGIFSTAICHDCDFPRYILQAGRGGADVLLNPTLDWKETTPLHTNMTVFRAVENGFSIMHPAGDGLSIAVDYHGNVLAVKNDFMTKNDIMFADIPVKGVRTIYSYTGDLFAWLCFIGLILILINFFYSKKKTFK